MCTRVKYALTNISSMYACVNIHVSTKKRSFITVKRSRTHVYKSSFYRSLRGQNKYIHTCIRAHNKYKHVYFPEGYIFSGSREVGRESRRWGPGVRIGKTRAHGFRTRVYVFFRIANDVVFRTSEMFYGKNEENRRRLYTVELPDVQRLSNYCLQRKTLCPRRSSRGTTDNNELLFSRGFRDVAETVMVYSSASVDAKRERHPEKTDDKVNFSE